MAAIFISYRRDDAQWPAARIFDRLACQFNPGDLFIDVDGIAPGSDFIEALGRHVGKCDALIAVVGRGWTSARGKEGGRRLDDPKDPVRIEIESALNRDISVIPVLIDDTAMPGADELPFSLKSFAHRQSITVKHESFSSDMDRLVRALPRNLQRERAERRSFCENGNASEQLGGYSHESVAAIEGRYLTLRPTFSLPPSIYAYCTEIKWDAGLCRLGFYDLDRPDKAFAHSGQVSAPHQSDAIYLVTNLAGKMRLTMLGRPTIEGEMFGLLTTLKPERGSRYTPATCPIALVPENKVGVPIDYGRLSPGTPEFAYAAGVLERVIEDGYATFLRAPRGQVREPARRVRTMRKSVAAMTGQAVV